LVFKDSIGTLLPRTAREMSEVGQRIDSSDLKPGDLVFFNTMRRAFSHVGIYLGDNRFMHAPRTGAEVRVENMESSYWVKRFNGARRILGGDKN
ncbi:MAG: C40 family peptidase, partial [Betaproteobacteria bacterium]|nr:C40 family peptidase [Betaproteobacteria bacterium]